MATVIDEASDLYDAMCKAIPWVALQNSARTINKGAVGSGQSSPSGEGASEAATDPVKQLNDEGRNKYNNGELEEAAECYQRALVLRPDSLVALYFLGVIAGRLKRYEKSKEGFERLVALLKRLGDTVDPILMADAHRGIGAALLGLWGTTGPQEPPQQLAKQAEREFRRAVELDPNDLAGWIGLGVALHILERIDEAEAAFRKALEIDPDNQAVMERLRSVLEDKLERRLFEQGYLTKINKSIRDFTPYDKRTPIKVTGKPLSEIIIEERR